MKAQADTQCSDRQFEVSDQVLLRPQPYTQSLVASRPYPKLSYKYFGPYRVLERIGKTFFYHVRGRLTSTLDEVPVLNCSNCPDELMN